MELNTRNWVDLAQDRDYGRALVNVAMNFQVPYAMELVSCQVEDVGSHTSTSGEKFPVLESGWRNS